MGETLATVDESLGLGRLSGTAPSPSRANWSDVRRRVPAAFALEAVGIGAKANELAIAYVSEREQFGKKIGTYQAILHSLVDGYVAVELSRSLAYWAAWASPRATSRSTSRSRPRSRRRPRRPCSRARSRSRPTAASASPGSTRCTATTSARSGSRARSGTAASTARRSPHPSACRLLLVTGASTGIGEATARGCPTAAGRSTHPCATPARRRTAARACLRRHRRGGDRARRDGIERLDALVDNAGIAIAAPLEFLPPEALSHQLDVNVVGQLRVLQAFLPALREARGRVVLMGSIAGRSALPFLGAYAMSKFALEAMADALRVELAPWGMHVAIVEPGTIATPIWTKPQRFGRRVAAGGAALYGERLQAFRRAAAERSSKRAAPVEVADAVEHALTAGRPKTRYLVGPDAKRRARVQRLPDRARDRVLSRFLFGNEGRRLGAALRVRAHGARGLHLVGLAARRPR